jgi:aryl-phospho-beta-D-glucosidase BglC (GH1 family)
MTSLTIQTAGKAPTGEETIKPGTFTVGVNLSGMEYNGGPKAVANSTYAIPSLSELEYYKSQGLDLIRLPISWESLQTSLGGPLSAAYLAEVESVVKNAASLGMKVIVDVHDYGGFNGVKIGTAAVTDADFANLWSRLATAFVGNAGIGGYDLMNEPSNMPTATAWTSAAQAAITAIRDVDTSTTIYVEGNDYSNAANWSTLNPGLAQLIDPSNNLVFSAHVYLDTNDSGTNFDWATEAAAGDTANIGVERLGNFVAWLQANNLKGDIGEVGVGNDNPAWLTGLNETLAYAKQSNLEVTYWAGGPWWGSYPMSVEPTNGLTAPQMAVLDKYSGDYPTVSAAVISGTTGANQVVYLSENDGLLGTVTANAAGAWSDTLSGLANGVHIIVAGDNLPTVDGTIAATVFDLVVATPKVISQTTANEVYAGSVGGAANSDQIINVSGANDTGVIYAGNYDTVNITGTDDLYLVRQNSDTVQGTSVSSFIGNSINLTGADTVEVFSDYNTIHALKGATVLIDAIDNTVTGSGINVQLTDQGDTIDLNGSDTINDVGSWSSDTSHVRDATQNFLTVLSGQVTLGGEDQLLQTGGKATIGLTGGDAATVHGTWDVIFATDSIYGGNAITNDGAHTRVFMTDLAGSATTINANASTYISITNASAAGARGTAAAPITGLLFIGSSATSDTVSAGASNTAVTLIGGASSGDFVHGGASGANYLNAGTGGSDVLVAGGNNDALIAGSAGNSTLVSAHGNETLVGSGMGNDLFSITGGGGTDLIVNFTGTLHLATKISLVSESVSGSSLQMSLSDGTTLMISNLTSLTQKGNVFIK